MVQRKRKHAARHTRYVPAKKRTRVTKKTSQQREKEEKGGVWREGVELAKKQKKKKSPWDTFSLGGKWERGKGESKQGIFHNGDREGESFVRATGKVKRELKTKGNRQSGGGHGTFEKKKGEEKGPLENTLLRWKSKKNIVKEVKGKRWGGTGHQGGCSGVQVVGRSPIMTWIQIIDAGNSGGGLGELNTGCL